MNAASPPQKPVVDQWAHRRGEPRLLAFYWTIYLLCAVLGSIWWVSRHANITSVSYGPAGRIMVLVVCVGACVLWPMIRLSQLFPQQQTPPTSATRALAHDMIVILFPMQMVIWPLVVLAQWPVNIALGVAGVMGAWVLLMGGVLNLAMSGLGVGIAKQGSGIGRTLWMVLVIGLVLGLPIVRLTFFNHPNIQLSEREQMLSPVLAVLRLTGSGTAGPQMPVSPVQWEMIGLVGVTGCVAWIWGWFGNWLAPRLGKPGEGA